MKLSTILCTRACTRASRGQGTRFRPKVRAQNSRRASSDRAKGAAKIQLEDSNLKLPLHPRRHQIPVYISMSQNLFGGLDRPTSLTSDSPFAIANNAMKDKSTPQAPKMKLPQSKAVAQAQQFAQQHQQQQQQREQQQYQQSQRPQYQQQIHQPSQQQYPTQPHPQQYQQPSPAQQPSTGPSRHPGAGQDQGMNPNALRKNARDAYMGAGAWNARTGTYGNTGPTGAQPQQGQGPTNADVRLSRSPSPYNSNPNFVAQQGFAQAVMMAQGGGGQSGTGGIAVGGANGVFNAPAFPTHYQQQFAEQTNPPAQAAYRQASYPPPMAQQQQQQQMHTAPSPSQYGQQNYQAQQSPASSGQGYGLQATSPYSNSQQQHRPTSSHHRQSQSPYTDSANYSSPAPVALASPAVILEHDSTSQGHVQSRPIPPAPAGTDVELWQMYVAIRYSSP